MSLTLSLTLEIALLVRTISVRFAVESNVTWYVTLMKQRLCNREKSKVDEVS